MHGRKEGRGSDGFRVRRDVYELAMVVYFVDVIMRGDCRVRWERLDVRWGEVRCEGV